MRDLTYGDAVISRGTSLIESAKRLRAEADRKQAEAEKLFRTIGYDVNSAESREKLVDRLYAEADSGDHPRDNSTRYARVAASYLPSRD
jgi:hypothetical protein